MNSGKKQYNTPNIYLIKLNIEEILAGSPLPDKMEMRFGNAKRHSTNWSEDDE